MLVGADTDPAPGCPVPRGTWRLRLRGGYGWALAGRESRWRRLWNHTVGRVTGLRWYASVPTLGEFRAALQAAVGEYQRQMQAEL